MDVATIPTSWALAMLNGMRGGRLWGYLVTVTGSRDLYELFGEV